MIFPYVFRTKSLRLMLGVAVILFIVAGLVFLNRGGSYHVRVGFSGDNYRDRSLSIDSDYLTESSEREGIRYREFTGGFSDAYLRLNARLRDNDRVSVSALIKSDDHVFLDLDCFSCENKGSYDTSVAFNTDFFYSHISDYKRITSFGDLEIYGKRELGRKWADATDMRQWLALNVQPRDTVGVWGDIDHDMSMVFPQKDHDQSMRKVEVHTRGGFESLVYLRDKAIIEIGKRDFNWYDGVDQVRVVLSDMRGYSLYSDIIDDDGFKKGEHGDEQRHTLELDIPEEGLYTLSLQEVSRDGQYYNDFEITTLRINTNKFMFSGEVMFQYATDIYYTSSEATSFSFFGWTAGNIQTLKLDKTRVVARLDAQDLNAWRKIVLPSGSHTLHLEKGLRVRSEEDMYFSIDSHLVFKPYRVDKVTLENPDIFITNVFFSAESDGWYWVTKYYRARDLLARWRHPNSLIRTLRLRLISPRNEEIMSRRFDRREQGLPDEQLFDVLLSEWRVMIRAMHL